MVKSTVTKNNFSQLNNKRIYFPDIDVFLPFYHPSLVQIDNFKQKKCQKIEKYFFEERERERDFVEDGKKGAKKSS